MKSEWTHGPLMLRLYLFIRKNDAILFWGGSVLAFMIGGWVGVAWWLLTLIAIAIGIPLWMFVWHFFRACFWPTREMKEAMLRASEEEERRNELLRQSAWQRERCKDRVRQWDWERQ